MKIGWILTHPQATQAVDEFVSSSEQIWGNLEALLWIMDFFWLEVMV